MPSSSWATPTAGVLEVAARVLGVGQVDVGDHVDYTLNGIFFRDLSLDDPDVYLDAVGADLGETVGNIIASSYKLMVETRPDALLILGDTNSCLSAIAAKRLHIPIFHMEAGNRCKDECLPGMRQQAVEVAAALLDDLGQADDLGAGAHDDE